MAFLATADAERSKAFYCDKIGLTLVADEPYAVVFHAGPTVLRVQKVESVTPAGYTALGWHAPDLSEDVRLLSERGVVFERYEFLEQDRLGVWTSPSGARVAWFKDPDGNVLSLTQGVTEP